MNRRRKRKALNSGTYGCVPVRPILPVRTLAAIDADGVVGSAGITAKSGRRLHRKALKEAERERLSWDSGLAQEIPQAEDDKEGSERLPTTPTSSRRLLRYAPKIPWHMASVSESGMLNPMGVSGWPSLDGPIIGHSVINGNVWRFDAWSPYRYDGTSVNGWIIGTMGSGKSTLLKAFTTRETTSPWNRQVLIEGDPKGEWASVALANGGQVVEVGNGRYLNPLDVAEKPSDVTDDDWASTVFGLRVGALESIASVL
ncbi:MAG: ATP-binding protein, partial [Bifidobacteriales bacterium]|nr:ATP-binding protein [Bifidobacteriales bacterium]